MKKAALSLSMNTIVILILVITLLGLGLSFMRGVFRDVIEENNTWAEEINCTLREIWNESKDCIHDYCYKRCWQPYNLGSMDSINENNYDFNNDSIIDPQERFVLDQNIKTAKECSKDCRKSPYGCFDYAVDIRCKQENLSDGRHMIVDYINLTTGEVIDGYELYLKDAGELK